MLIFNNYFKLKYLTFHILELMTLNFFIFNDQVISIIWNLI
jgi:hypothetical protein